MPRTSEANAQIKEERRQEILTAALKLFSVNGYEATKIGDIAAEANVSHGLVYHYFNSKEEILSELVREAAASMIEFIQTAAALPFSAAEKLEAIMAELIARLDAAGRPQYGCTLVLGAIKSGDATASLIALPLQYVIVEGQRDGAFGGGDPRALAYFLFAALLGLAEYKAARQDFELPAASTLVNMIRE